MKLSELRRSAGMSQRELAKSVGLTAPAITQYETGKRNPNIAMICRLAKALKVSEQEIILCLKDNKPME